MFSDLQVRGERRGEEDALEQRWRQARGRGFNFGDFLASLDPADSVALGGGNGGAGDGGRGLAAVTADDGQQAAPVSEARVELRNGAAYFNASAAPSSQARTAPVALPAATSGLSTAPVVTTMAAANSTPSLVAASGSNPLITPVVSSTSATPSCSTPVTSAVTSTTLSLSRSTNPFLTDPDEAFNPDIDNPFYIPPNKDNDTTVESVELRAIANRVFDNSEACEELNSDRGGAVRRSTREKNPIERYSPSPIRKGGKGKGKGKGEEKGDKK